MFISCSPLNFRVNMTSPYIIIRRYPYEEPYATELSICVSNGYFGGEMRIFVNVEDIAKIGQELKKFPEFPLKQDDEYRYEVGSQNLEEKCSYYFLLRAYTINSVGNCAIQIAMNLNGKEPYEGLCKFSIQTDPINVNRLGELLEDFSKLQHRELRWAIGEGELYEDYV